MSQMFLNGRLLHNGRFWYYCRLGFLAEQPAAKQYHGVIAHPMAHPMPLTLSRVNCLSAFGTLHK